MRVAVSSAVMILAGTTAVFAANAPGRAVAVLHPTQGNSVEGKVTFSAVAAGGVKVNAHITGLTAGKHGFHIHEFGDCSAPDAASAGGHFNPSGDPHAGPTDAKRHAGDMGNVEANKEGVADIEYVDAKASLEGASSVLGRGVIVHANPDDFKTQPTGNAGGRVACGVIGVAKSE
jgi:superoxide dismutase, Cu-Zn family